MAEEYDEQAFNEEGEVEYDEYGEEEEDGYVEEVGVDDDEIGEEAGDEADDEEDGAGANGGQGQMLYIPGLGYIPLSSLGNIPGLSIGRSGAAQVAAPPAEGEREWETFAELPEVTQQSFLDLFSALEDEDRTSLTIMMLGKGGVGKSSTINSILNERAANVMAFQMDNAKPTVYSRRVQNFTIHLIDTPSVLDQDAVSDGRLEAIGKLLKDRPIDAVVFLERIDCYAVDAVDQAVINGITRVLGPEIWQNTILGLTRSSEGAQPAGLDFAEFAEQRAQQIKDAITKSGADAHELPYALIENSSQCETNADGEKIVPEETPWLADTMEKIVETALNAVPYEFNPKQSGSSTDPNKKRRWLIPVVIAVQVGLKLLLDRVMDDDGCKGDNNGPFDEQTVKERRAELKAEKQKARKKKKQRAAAASAAPASQENGDFYAGDDLLDEDFDLGSEEDDF